MENSTDTKTNYLQFLPSVYGEVDKDFFNNFLKVFEKILTGINDGEKVDGQDVKSISETIDAVSKYFYPYKKNGDKDTCDIAPKEFLEWLSFWLGLVLKENWPESRKREVIAKIIPLYRMRGTKKGFEEFLNIYIDKGVSIDDNFAPFIVGVNSFVEKSTRIGVPYFFIVETVLSEIDFEARNRKVNNIKAVIDREKPVHTDYKIKWKDVPSLQIEIEGRTEVEIHTWLWNYE